MQIEMNVRETSNCVGINEWRFTLIIAVSSYVNLEQGGGAHTPNDDVESGLTGASNKKATRKQPH